jgi:Leucine-rich repeat (LRR) protein
MTSIPPEIGRLTALTWLDLKRNKLTSVPGRAVQVDPMLTPGWPRDGRAGFQRLKLQYDEPISDFGYNFNLRHYIQVNLGGSKR